MTKPVLWFCGALCWTIVYADEYSFKNLFDCICSLHKSEVKKKKIKGGSYISREELCLTLSPKYTIIAQRVLQGMPHTQQKRCPSEPFLADLARACRSPPCKYNLNRSPSEIPWVYQQWGAGGLSLMQNWMCERAWHRALRFTFYQLCVAVQPH